jgi:hypothetical protein
MFRRSILAFVVFFLIASAAPGQSSVTGGKGYELYSWKIKGHWYYSLLPRGTRAKTFVEITGSELVRRGTSGLTSSLGRLPKGEEVFWMGDAPAGASRFADEQALSLKHPSRKRIKRIKAICEKLGIKMSLA